jgi:molecular chaperone DnaJ
MTTRESYRILGVTTKAGWEEVRRRFRILVQKYHPDRNPDNPKAAARFRRVMEAYETVRAHRNRTPQSKKPYYRSHRSDKQGFFEEVLGIKPHDEPLARAMGPDFRYDLSIPLVDAILGLSTTIMVPRLASCHHCLGSGRIPLGHPQTCPDCGGQGRPIKGPGLFRGGPACRRCRGRGFIQDQFCLACDGTGHYQQFKHYSLNIPPGTEDGARLRFVGEGGKSQQDGPPGNLEVVISVQPHEFFTRKGRDLHCQFKVSFVRAALGGEVRIPTLQGYARLNLPPGTQNGRVFRFPAVGAPGNSQQPPGDQIVEVVVTTPECLNLAQRNIMEELARLEKTEINRVAHE